MPFDPTLPAPNSQILSNVLRNQFNALKLLCDTNTADVSQRAFKPVDVPTLDITISNPPTTLEVRTLLEKVNELIATLQS